MGSADKVFRELKTDNRTLQEQWRQRSPVAVMRIEEIFIEVKAGFWTLIIDLQRKFLLWMDHKHLCEGVFFNYYFHFKVARITAVHAYLIYEGAGLQD